jgi:UDP-2,4-diacetamido-2,4,6-trideoxy-beta-L-altropyranose hydrolase
MRCLALAQGWRRTGGQTVFAMASSTPALQKRLQDEGLRVVTLNATAGSPADADQTVTLARQIGASWVVADGYHFDAAYQRRVKESGLRLLVLDDYGHASHYAADLVLNQNLHARADLYASRELYTRLLLGTRYALLREEFLKWRDWHRDIPDVARKVLVTLGGTDPDNVTGKVVEALRTLPVEAKIVVGGSNPHFDSLSSVVRPPSSVICDVPNMPELMAWADIAVSAGGSTTWELAFMGLPGLAVVLADNQKDVVRRLDDESVSVALGTHTVLTNKHISNTLQSLIDDNSRRTRMSQCGRLLVDGAGVARVVTRLCAVNVHLRRANPQDCRRLWEWANDPAVRASAFSTEPIPWDNHQAWFAAKLADPMSAIFIAIDGKGTPFGQIRFDRNGQAGAEVDVHVTTSERGRGLGSALICAGVEEMLETKAVRMFHAFVKCNNSPSLRAFRKAGFTYVKQVTAHGQEAYHLTLVKDNE